MHKNIINEVLKTPIAKNTQNQNLKINLKNEGGLIQNNGNII